MQTDANTAVTPEPKTDPKKLKEARRAAALRANLRRRKGRVVPVSASQPDPRIECGDNGALLSAPAGVTRGSSK